MLIVLIYIKRKYSYITLVHGFNLLLLAPACLEHNTDYFGNDLGTGDCGTQPETWRRETAEECQNLCRDTDGCDVFTWISPNHNYVAGRKRCCLKTLGGVASSSPDLVSGPKICVCTQWCQTGLCVAGGPREPENDKSCHEEINMESGYCECTGGRKAMYKGCSSPQRYGYTYTTCNAACSETIEVDGMWGYWSAWSSCSKSCGGGKRSRSLTCINPEPPYSGKKCAGRAHEDNNCNTQSCPVTFSMARYWFWCFVCASCIVFGLYCICGQRNVRQWEQKCGQK